MPGKFFDDFVVGEEYVTPGRTLTETDVVMFSAMSGDYNELHTSEAFGKTTPFGRRIGQGLLGLAVSHGLFFRLGLVEGTAIAFLGIDSWKFEAPFFLGDTIRVKVQVAEKTPSRSKPDRGVIRFFFRVLKEDQTVIQSGFKTIMIRRKQA
jgi:acyl dehydratase